MELEVGMYVKGKYDRYRGKIGKIIKNYRGDLEIAYNDSIVKTTVNSFIYDNFDINGKQYVASHNIIDLIEVGDYVNGHLVTKISEDGFIWLEGFSIDGVWRYVDFINEWGDNIKSIVTKEQFSAMEYRLGDK